MRFRKPRPELTWARIVAVHEKDGEASRACADILNMIRLDGAQTDAKSFLFTSAIESEGKTTMALNFAGMLAARGQRVLLADVHWQRPTLGRMLGVSDRRGVTDLLEAGGAHEDLLVQDARLPQLSVLPRGTRDMLLLQGRAEERMRALLERVKSSFDYVFLDGASAASGPDVRILDRLVDAVLLVIACDRTQQTQVAAARQTMAQHAGTRVGVILNRVPRYLPDYYRTV
jgi:capsular exopolysaccharide synthesis family protein